jgi:DNA topoisomerase-1
VTAGSGRQPRPEGGPDALGAGPLRFASPDDPGYRRRRAGRGFRFEDADGRPVTDDAELARFRRLVIPPAWTEVWICADPNGHLQAVGRDARGRRQYRYHPRFRARRDADKFKRLIEFGAALPRIRRRVRADLATRGLSREKVIAAVVALLDSTHLRVGNDEYARLNRSFGLSTLRSRHASVDGGTIEFRFRGKGGRIEERKLVDRSLAAVVRRCQELPGQALFQYPDGDDATEIRRVSSEDVNAYIRAAAGTDDFSAKDFRTWAATLLAFRAMDAAKAAVTITAEALGDTPTVARNSYIHPAVLDEIDGAAAAPSASGAAKADRAPADAADPADPKRALATPTRRDELALLAFLRRKRRRTSAGAGASKPTSRASATRSKAGARAGAIRSGRRAA